jgi:tight adherence protein B
MPQVLISNPLLVPAGLFLLIMIIFIFVIARRGGRGSSVDERLNQYAGRQGEVTQEVALKERIDKQLTKGGRGSNVARDLARADLKLTVTEFIGLKFLSLLAFAGLGAFLGRASELAMLIVAVIAAFIGWFVPDFVVSWLQKKRVRAFNNQLGDTVNLLANSLRSGYSLLQSMELVSREAPPPVSHEFRRVVQEVGLGLSTNDALDNMLRRVPSDDLDLMVTAINIQFEVGGNLSQILETIGHTIRERVRIKGQIRVLTSQARISGYVITFMPIGLAAMIATINPGYIGPLFTFGMPPQAWCCFPACSLAMIAAGGFVIQKIVDIEV